MTLVIKIDKLGYINKEPEIRGYKLSEYSSLNKWETPYMPLFITGPLKSNMKTEYNKTQWRSIEQTKRMIKTFTEFQNEKYNQLLSELGLTKEDSREEYLFDYIFNDYPESLNKINP